MCGRYVSVQSDADLTEEFDVDAIVGEEVTPSWNVAPTDPVRIVVQRSPHVSDAEAGTPVRQLRTARWGLVPSWSRDAKGGARMINARIETVTSKPAFRKAAASRRCLIPALGYYEWQQASGRKIPYFLHDPHSAPLAFAGLYELWRDPSRADDDPARWLWTCTIVTQQASDLIGDIHDRNPVVVPAPMRAAWLDCSSADVDVAAELLQRIPEAHLEPYVVSAEVGNVRNNGPQLIEPADEPTNTDRPTQQQLLEL